MKTKLSMNMPFDEIIVVVKEMAIKSRLTPEDVDLKNKLSDARKFCEANDIEGLYQEGRNLARSQKA